MNNLSSITATSVFPLPIDISKVPEEHRDAYVASIQQGRENQVRQLKKTLNNSPPTVVRLRRRHGQIIQDCDVYIGRAVTLGGWNLPSSKWANPFKVNAVGLDKALELYEQYLLSSPELMNALPELCGKTLGCWCKPGKCHGDILVKHYKSTFL